MHAKRVRARDRRHLAKLWADGAYGGAPLREHASALGVDLGVVERHEGPAFVVAARRWVVERTFAWLVRYRRLVHYFERLSRTVEALTWVAMTRLLLNRLAPAS